MTEPTTAPATDETTEAVGIAETVEADALVESELLVEDVSIDGMCGVY
jgi:mycofactocin precursor